MINCNLSFLQNDLTVLKFLGVVWHLGPFRGYCWPRNTHLDNPDKPTREVGSSEFEKKELFDPNQIAALIDKAKEEQAETERKNNKLTQSSVKNSFAEGLSLSEEDALKAQIFGCWSVPLGLPYDKNLLVRIKLQLKQDGTILKSEILDHERMNIPGQSFYKVLAESALRAIRICQPLRVPPTGYEKWKDLQLILPQMKW